MSDGITKNLIRLIRSVIDSYMEGFETAFPATVKKVNSDGTVDVTPSIRNVLKNMQIEPDGKDGKPLPVEGVPVMNIGTSAAIVKFELAEGDPVLCVASSRDLRSWVGGGENKGPFDPLSFSGNDMNDLVAIPMSRGGSKKVSLTISHDGSLNVEANTDVSIKSPNVKIEGALEVTGNLEVGGDVSSDGTVTGSMDVVGGGISVLTHIHSGGTIEGMTGGPQSAPQNPS